MIDIIESDAEDKSLQLVKYNELLMSSSPSPVLRLT